jgi:hypothetical protein
MAARGEDDFDVLKFFIAVMVLLTTFVGAYAFYLRSQVVQLSTQIKAQVRTLDEMKKVAEDAPFREWISRERETHQGDRGNSVTDFKALLVQAAPEFHLNYVLLPSQEGMQDYRVAQEIPFRMSFDGCRVEDLVRFLAHVEEKWPGAKTREIQQLEFDEKKQTWKAALVVSIFKSTT